MQIALVLSWRKRQESPGYKFFEAVKPVQKLGY
jgi:hypothetical protein